jgi:hypothetical protein
LKIAAYIHPVSQALGPNFSCGWFEILARLLQALRRDAGCDCMMIAGNWPSQWAIETGREHLLEGLRLVELDEVSLYRKLSALGALPTTLDRIAYGKGERNCCALEAITDEIARGARGFEPDVIISFAVQIDFLAALWPKALRVHVESGPFSRNPYPFSLFFDHLGIYGRSIIGQAGRRLRTQPVADDAVELVGAFRNRNKHALDGVDPFRAINLRAKFDRVILLPLQVSNYYSFNEQTHYRTQFEFLLDVLSATPRDVGVVVTEYLEWGHVLRSEGSGENIAYLQTNFSNLIFVDRFRSYLSPSQFIVPRVDGVWSVSSNVGYQALLYNRALGSPPTSHLAEVAHTATLDGFFSGLADSAPVNNDALLAWLLQHYLIPDALLSDGRWLRDYLARRIQAASDTADPIDAFVPVANLDRLIEAWIVKAPKPAAARYEQPLDVALADARVARAEARVAQQSLDTVLHSRSWRLTAPMRNLSVAVRAYRNQSGWMPPLKGRHEPVLVRPPLPAR